MKVNLILNGHLNLEHLQSKLKPDDVIYAIDGAYDKISLSNIKADKIIGDLDSLEIRPKNIEIIELQDQDHTDFEKALMYLPEEFEKIDVYGASGLEQDHFLGNLHVAKKYINRFKITFYDEFQQYLLFNNHVKIDVEEGTIISIIPFSELRGVTSEGLKYPLQEDNLTIGNFISIRNLAVQKNISLTSKGGTGVLFIKDQCKKKT